MSVPDTIDRQQVDVPDTLGGQHIDVPDTLDISQTWYMAFTSFTPAIYQLRMYEAINFFSSVKL